MVEAIRLFGSNKILVTPPGELDLDTLTELLEEATQDGLARHVRVITTEDRRVKNFNEQDPQWKEIERVRTVGYLHELYHLNYGRNFSLTDVENAREQHYDMAEKQAFRNAWMVQAFYHDADQRIHEKFGKGVLRSRGVRPF